MPDSQLRRIMFTSQKGGVGKTASAVNVAACLGDRGERVLLVDTDPIGSVAACFGTMVAPGHPGVYGMGQWPLHDLILPDVAPNVDLLPYSEDRRPIDLNALHLALDRLQQPAARNYGFLIVDTRPSVADMTRRLCQVVDEVVVVFQCHPLAYRTLGGILGQLRDARADGAGARLLGLLLTMVDGRDPRGSQLEAHIRRSLGQALFPISIPHDPLVSEGLMADRPVALYQPDSPVAQAYRELSETLLSATPVAA
ncbi:MAG: ParA family protein [SAR202 cluster bacterium]|nr:ParA family protein [SAR202 cluster bacterium]